MLKRMKGQRGAASPFALLSCGVLTVAVWVAALLATSADTSVAAPESASLAGDARAVELAGDPGWTRHSVLSRRLTATSDDAAGCVVRFDRAAWPHGPANREIALVALAPDHEPAVLSARLTLTATATGEATATHFADLHLPLPDGSAGIPPNLPGLSDWIRVRPAYQFRGWRIGVIELTTEIVRSGPGMRYRLDSGEFRIRFAPAVGDLPGADAAAVTENPDVLDVMDRLVLNRDMLPALWNGAPEAPDTIPPYLRGKALIVYGEKPGFLRTPANQILDVLGAGVRKNDIAVYFHGQPYPAVFASDVEAGRIDESPDAGINPGDGLLIYSPGVVSPYSVENAFWIVLEPGGARPVVASGQPIPEVAETLTVDEAWRLEEDHVDYWDDGESMKKDHEQDDFWFWQLAAPGSPFRRTLPIHGVSPQAASATVTVEIASSDMRRRSAPLPGQAAVRFNGRLIPAAEIGNVVDRPIRGYGRFDFAATTEEVAAMARGASFTIEIGCAQDMEGAMGRFDGAFYINAIRIQSRREVQLRHGAVRFTAAPSETAWRVPSDFEYYRQLLAVAVLPDGTPVYLPTRRDGNSFHVHSGAVAAAGLSPGATCEFFFQDMLPAERPRRYRTREGTPLRTSARQADALILSPRFFADGAEALRRMYERHDLSAAVVWTDDLYDEFGAGEVTPFAIRDFLRHAYRHWPRPAPAYVLLVGDASWDWKGRFRNAIPNLLPAYRKDPYYASDNWYACVSGDDAVPDFFLGRLPVQHLRHLEIALAKGLNALEDPDIGPWRGRALFVSDNYENAGNVFEKNTRELMENWAPPGLDKVQLSFRDFAYEDNRFVPEADVIAAGGTMKYSPDANRAIVRELREGRALFEYYGHGGPNVFGHERILFGGGSIYSDIKQLDNIDRLPFVTGMTCDSGRFDYADVKWNLGIGEELLLHDRAGAIGVFAASGKGYPHQHLPLMEGIHEAIFRYGWRRMGVVTTVPKLLYAATRTDESAIDMFLLLGDPLVPVPLAETALPMELNRADVDLRYGAYVQATVRLPDHWPRAGLKARVFARDGADREFFARNDVPVEGSQFQFGFDVTRNAAPGLFRVGCYIYRERFDRYDPIIEGIGSAEFRGVPADAEAAPETGLPNLRVLAPLVPSDGSPRSGRTLFIDARIENAGTRSATEVAVKAYLGNPDEGAPELRNIVDWPDTTIPVLAPGARETVRFRWDPFQNAGRHTITVRVDPDNRIEESDKTDNTLSWPLTVLRKADLVFDPEGTRVRRHDANPDVLLVSPRLTNAGESKADGFLPPGDHRKEAGADGLTVWIRYFDRPDTVPAIRPRPLRALAPGESFPIWPPLAMTPGIHRIELIADPDEIVDEETHDNNSMTITYEEALRLAIEQAAEAEGAPGGGSGQAGE